MAEFIDYSLDFSCGYEEAEKMTRFLPTTSTYVHNQNLPMVRDLLQSTIGYVAKTSNMMGREFLEAYSHDRMRKIGNPKPGSLDLLQRNNLHLPQFGIFDVTSASDFLAQADMEYEIDPQNLLLVFNFPPTIDRCYDNTFQGPDGANTAVVDWFLIGNRLKQMVWENKKLYSESAGKLSFSKLNAKGEHIPGLYHYIWEVSEPVGRHPKQSFK